MHQPRAQVRAGGRAARSSAGARRRHAAILVDDPSAGTTPGGGVCGACAGCSTSGTTGRAQPSREPWTTRRGGSGRVRSGSSRAGVGRRRPAAGLRPPGGPGGAGAAPPPVVRWCVSRAASDLSHPGSRRRPTQADAGRRVSRRRRGRANSASQARDRPVLRGLGCERLALEGAARVGQRLGPAPPVRRASRDPALPGRRPSRGRRTPRGRRRARRLHPRVVDARRSACHAIEFRVASMVRERVDSGPSRPSR